jgi:hypothetical protein
VSVPEPLTRQLFDAIEEVRRDVNTVEMWALALVSFAHPVPDYDPKKLMAWFMRDRALH